MRKLVEATGISHGTVISILHEQLSMKKLSTRWVPHLLTVDYKHGFTRARHRWPNSTNSVTNYFPIQHIHQI